MFDLLFSKTRWSDRPKPARFMLACRLATGGITVSSSSSMGEASIDEILDQSNEALLLCTNLQT